jgi:hypothetical protein
MCVRACVRALLERGLALHTEKWPVAPNARGVERVELSMQLKTKSVALLIANFLAGVYYTSVVSVLIICI